VLDRGVWRFDSAELARVPTRAESRQPARLRRRAQTAGERAARIFRMFETGKELIDIVLTTREHPTTVRQLYREWCSSLEEGERERERRVRRVLPR
jgi:hypothetical protein